jgi:rod shape determining protein RodA
MNSKKYSYILLITLIIASVLGLLTLISTEINIDGVINWSGIVRKQIIFMSLGGLIYFIASRIDHTYLRYPLVLAIAYVGIIVLLAATKLWAPTINGVQRWLIIGGGQVQASEFAKILVILYTASAFSFRTKINEWAIAGITFLLTLPILILVYIQPHGSMSVLIFAIWAITTFVSMGNIVRNSVLLLEFLGIALGILLLSLQVWIWGIVLLLFSFVFLGLSFYAKNSAKIAILIVLVVGVFSGVVISATWENYLQEYQAERITSFFARDSANPEDCDNCFNVNQSLIAIGSGGIWGKGFGYGTQSRLQFLPEHQTDFIFASYAEQFGLVGSVFLIGIYALMIFTILIHSHQKSNDSFASIILLGIAVKFLLEVFVNLGTNMGLIPATGSPLPLFSAGGSITFAAFFSIGLVQSIIANYNNNPNVKDFVDKEELLI